MRLYLRLFLTWPGNSRCLFFGGGRVRLTVPGVHLRVAGREDEQVRDEDEDTGGEHRDDDGHDYVQLSVLLGIVICSEEVAGE